MPLNIQNLDDRNFTDLLEEALSMLPRYAPEWTNHNPSDPGITLIELLAYFSEMLIYRLNRVSRQNKIKFLQLLREVEDAEKNELAAPETSVKKLDEVLDQAVLALRQPQRAVTCDDYEELAQRVAVKAGNSSPVKRVRCFMRINLEALDKERQAPDNPGHVSVIIVPGSGQQPEAIEALLEKTRLELEPKRLLTTRLHVVEPLYLYLSLGAAIHSLPGTNAGDLRQEAVQKLEAFFDPLPDQKSHGEGWPFGRAVYLSEVYEQLEQIDGVDFVEDVRLLRLSVTEKVEKAKETTVGIQIGEPSAATVGESSRIGGNREVGGKRLVRDKFGRLILVMLRPYELVKVSVRSDELFVDPHMKGPQSKDFSSREIR